MARARLASISPVRKFHTRLATPHGRDRSWWSKNLYIEYLPNLPHAGQAMSSSVKTPKAVTDCKILASPYQVQSKLRELKNKKDGMKKTKKSTHTLVRWDILGNELNHSNPTWEIRVAGVFFLCGGGGCCNNWGAVLYSWQWRGKKSVWIVLISKPSY